MHKRFGFIGLDLDDSTDAIPDKYVGTFGLWEGEDFVEEVAVIVHRASDTFPLDGPEARAKEADLAALADILNTAAGWIDKRPHRFPLAAVDDLAAIADLAKEILDRH